MVVFTAAATAVGHIYSFKLYSYYSVYLLYLYSSPVFSVTCVKLHHSLKQIPVLPVNTSTGGVQHEYLHTKATFNSSCIGKKQV